MPTQQVSPSGSEKTKTTSTDERNPTVNFLRPRDEASTPTGAYPADNRRLSVSHHHWPPGSRLRMNATGRGPPRQRQNISRPAASGFNLIINFTNSASFDNFIGEPAETGIVNWGGQPSLAL
jgi:hypothetical protein